MDQTVVEVWNRDSNFALKFTKFLLWPLGVWFGDCNSPFALSRLVFAITTQVYVVTVQLAAFIKQCGDPNDAVDYIMLAVCALMALTKIITFRVHMDKIGRVFSSALQDWLSVNDDDRNNLKPYSKYGRRIFFFQMGFCYLSNTLIAIGTLPFLIPSPMLNQTADNDTGLNTSVNGIMRELPLKTGCMLANLRDGFYASFYLFESLAINFSAHGNVGCDLVIITLLMHICGQIELLKINLQKIGPSSEESIDPHDLIKKHIHRHGYLLSLARDLNIAVSGMLVVQLFLNAWMNLMLGLRILMALQKNMYFDAVRPVLAFNVLMLQLYLLSYASDRLCQQSETVLDAFYDSYWYELPAKVHKDLNFVAMRANKPIYLVAGDFYVMNMENFKNVLKASFSYFSVLRIMFEG